MAERFEDFADSFPLQHTCTWPYRGSPTRICFACRARELGRKRVRWRVRLISWRGLHHVLQTFPEGTVRRIWVGWLLVTIMVKADA